LLTVGTVTPGYDDTKIRVNGTKISREGNETYRKYWRPIHEYSLDWVLITSWNEWHEGTEIEPSRENGYSALYETRKQVEKFMGN
ncbi:MAG: glycoside hydrolase family 99-like domain-containing protein, partial [archaeon]